MTSLISARFVGAALVSGYKIDGKRIAAKGVASLVPVASNAADAGRARNRRVELVAQYQWPYAAGSMRRGAARRSNHAH